MVFHWRLSDSKYPQVSRTLLIIIIIIIIIINIIYSLVIPLVGFLQYH